MSRVGSCLKNYKAQSTESSAAEDERRSRSRSKTRTRDDDDAALGPSKKSKSERKKEKALRKAKKRECEATNMTENTEMLSPQKPTIKEISVICENLSQPIRPIKREAVESHETQVDNPSSHDVELMSPEPWTEVTGMAKKRRAASPLETDTSYLQEVRDITAAVRGVVLNEGYKVTKWLAEKILNQCGKYEKVLQKMAAENIWLRSKLEAAEENKTMLDATCKKLCAEVTSIKDSLKHPPPQYPPALGPTFPSPDPSAFNRFSTPSTPRSYALIVKGDKEALTTDEIKRRMAEGVTDVNVRVRSVRPMRSGGVVVEMASCQERELLRKHQSFTDAGLKVVEPKKFNPRVVIYDVPTEMKDDVIIRGLCQKNLAGFPRADELQGIKVIKRLVKKEQSLSNVIVDLPPACCRKILQDGRAFVGWSSYKVASWEYVPRCYKCHAYGHMAKDCQKEQLCWKCCNPGHLAITCTAQEDCGNCRERKWPSNHQVSSSTCPVYLARLQWLRSKTVQLDHE